MELVYPEEILKVNGLLLNYGDIMKLLIDIAGTWVIKDNGEKIALDLYLLELYLKELIKEL